LSKIHKDYLLLMMNESKKIVKNVELDTKNQKQEVQLRIKDM
jgi:hypothetical protein